MSGKNGAAALAVVWSVLILFSGTGHAAGDSAAESAAPVFRGMNGPQRGMTPGPLLLRLPGFGADGARHGKNVRYRRRGDGAAGMFPALLYIYRNVISPVDGDRCDMAPTCSLYSRQVLARYGTLAGILLTADRLLHEADEQPLAAKIHQDGETYYLDPPDHNTFWWPEWMRPSTKGR